MNPYTAAIARTGLNSQQTGTREFETAALAVLSLAEQLDTDPFSGVDYFTEVERRLRDVFNLPPHFVQLLATRVFAESKHKLQRGQL